MGVIEVFNSIQASKWKGYSHKIEKKNDQVCSMFLYNDIIQLKLQFTLHLNQLHELELNINAN